MAYVDWIKIEHTTPTKSEVVQIAAILKINPYEVLGRLVQLWIWADQNTTNGRTFVQEMSSIDFLTGKDGFGLAMKKAGWLTAEGDGFVFPNFLRHNGKSAKKRAEDARKKKDNRTNVPLEDGHLGGQKEDVPCETSSSTSVSSLGDGGVGEGNVCIGDPPKTRKQKAASLATEYRFRIPGVRKQMLEDLTPIFEEKLRVYGDDKYDFILGKIKGERDKSLAMFHFWKLCGMDGDSLLPPPAAPAGKSAEQLRHEANLERLSKMNGGQRANG